MRLVMVVLFGFSMVWGSLGEEVFKKHCISCHALYIPQSQLLLNFKNKNRDLNLKAPTLNQLSFNLKKRVGDRKADAESQKFEIENFIAEYLEHPDKSKGILPKDINQFFKTMPVMKNMLNEDEIEQVTAYIYDYAENMMIKHGVKRYTFEEAVKKAKKEHKIIFIEGYLTYCRFCIRMDREVLVEEDVKKVLNKDFILVKINLGLEKLPLGLRRLGTPAFYFIKSNGKDVIDMIEGFGTKEEFIELLNDVKKRSK